MHGLDRAQAVAARVRSYLGDARQRGCSSMGSGELPPVALVTLTRDVQLQGEEGGEGRPLSGAEGDGWWIDLVPAVAAAEHALRFVCVQVLGLPPPP